MSILMSDIQCIDNRSKDEKAIRELAENIGALGLLNPVTLQKNDNGKHFYKVIAGRRRFRALQLLEHTELKEGEYRIVEADADMVAFCENFHRSQLTIQEELEQLKYLSEKYGSQNTAFFAKELGKSEAWVRTRIRLLNLSPRWKSRLDAGDLPLSYLEEVGKYPVETQEKINGYRLQYAKSAKEAARMISEELVVKLPEKHWAECDSCPKNPATDTFFFSDCPASCTDRDCLNAKLAADLEPVINSYREKSIPLFIKDKLDNYRTEEFFEKKFKIKFFHAMDESGEDNVLIIYPTHFKITRGTVKPWERDKVNFAPEAKGKSAGTSASDPKAQLDNLMNKLTGKRYATAICNFLAFLENTESSVPECLMRFPNPEHQLRMLLLKYGYRAGSAWENKKLETFADKLPDTPYFETVLTNIINEIHERLRCLHLDCVQVDLIKRKKDIEYWAGDLCIDFNAEYLAPAIEEIPETKRILELKSSIKVR